ncbi:MAG: M16 family metallopeptidase [Thermomicrobiales bacterium]
MSENRAIFERTLPNGLKVILRESHDAPLASFWVWYRVGSRNESAGLTGLSHWVEHMQFKGTPSLGKGAIFREVTKNGGTLNALTSNDWTGYFETLPADRIDMALQIESDRMANSLFDPAETESERTVILSERQGAENSPTYLLFEEVVATAFHAHPYRHMVIGYESDLKRISRDDLYGHYRRAYHPANAFITAAGDFDAEDLYRRIQDQFGSIQAGSTLPPVAAVEPPQRGERRVTLRQPAPTSYLRMAFHTPEGRHPDTAAIFVADAVLSGGKGMGFGGGGQMGRSARLYRSLVAAGLARAAGSDFELTIDPFLLIVGLTALPGADPSQIETVIDGELDRLATETVPTEELGRAVKQVKAQYVYSGEGVTNQAYWLGQMEVVDSYQRAERLLHEIETVTPADVQRVAATYLRPENRTVGWLFPDGRGGGPSDDASDGAPIAFRRWYATGHAQTDRPPFERHELPNGIVVLGQAQPADPAVSALIRIQAGAAQDPSTQQGLAAYTARSLTRGTQSLTFDAFNELTDSLGATLGVEAGRLFTEISIRCLPEDLHHLLELAADVLRRPTFPADEVEKVRGEILTAIVEQEDDTHAVADRTLRELLYPDGHPYRHRVLGTSGPVNAIGRDDLARFHASHFGPAVMTAAVVGGIPSVATAVQLIRSHFGDWNTGATRPEPVAAPAIGSNGATRKTHVAGKSQTDVAAGTLTLARSHPDYHALETANLILGRLGLMGRLGANVRDEQGLAYYVFSVVEPGKEGGVWISRAGVDPANAERALDGIVSELHRLRKTRVDDDELADAKSFMTGSLPLALEMNDGVASLLLAIEHYGLGLDYVDRYPAIINALTAEDLQRAAFEHLDETRLAVGIAGP